MKYKYTCDLCGKEEEVDFYDKIYHMSFAYSHTSRVYQLCKKCYDGNVCKFDIIKNDKNPKKYQKLNIQKEIYGILSGKVGRIDDPYVEKALINIEEALTKIQNYINKE